jgi:hypothetical protein
MVSWLIHWRESVLLYHSPAPILRNLGGGIHHTPKGIAQNCR